MVKKMIYAYNEKRAICERILFFFFKKKPESVNEFTLFNKSVFR